MAPQPQAEHCPVPAQPPPGLGSTAKGTGSPPAVGREPGTSLAAWLGASLTASCNCTSSQRWKGISLSHALSASHVGQARFHPGHGTLTMPWGRWCSRERAQSMARATHGASHCVDRSCPRCRCCVRLNIPRGLGQTGGMGRCSLQRASQPGPGGHPGSQPPQEGRGAVRVPEEGRGESQGWGCPTGPSHRQRGH